MTEIIHISMACNDPDNGNFLGRVCQISLPDSMLDLTARAWSVTSMRGCPKLNDNWQSVGAPVFRLAGKSWPFFKRRCWAGNWCWDRVPDLAARPPVIQCRGRMDRVGRRLGAPGAADASGTMVGAMTHRIDTVAVVSVSGGKDSQETANRAIDTYGPDRVRIVMADTGNEHPLCMEFVMNDLPAMLGVPITILRADFSRQIEGKRRFVMANWEYMGVPLAQIDRALEALRPTGNPYLDLCIWKGRFPSPKAQFCTQELKVFPLDEFTLSVMRETGMPAESWQGIRRDESRNRSEALAYEPPTMDRPWAIVRPIVDLTAQQTVDAITARRQRLNPLYSLGMTRVGCMPCINCGKDELLEIASRWPDEVARIREWELIVAAASKRNSATFFSDPIKQGRRRPGLGEGYARIDEVITWAKTSRGGKQFDLIRAIPSPVCSSVYGLCE